MRWTLTIAAMLLAGLASGSQTAWGQMSSSSGMFGSRSLGSSLSAGQSTAFGSSFGSSMGGLGSMGGQSGLGGLSGMSSFGSQMGGMSQLGGNQAGQQRRAGDFVGATSQQLNGRGFVGAQQAGNGTGLGQGSQGVGMSGMQGLGRGGGFSSMQDQSGQYHNGQSGMYGNGRNSVPVRTTLTMNIETPSGRSPQVNSSLTQRLAGLPALHWQSTNRVEMRGRTAVLRGVVATEHDRELAERVVRLEASVDQVENQLAVSSSSTKAVQ